MLNFVPDLPILTIKKISTGSKELHALPCLTRHTLDSQQDGLDWNRRWSCSGCSGEQYQKFPDGNSPLKLFTPFNFCIRFQNYCSSDVQQSFDRFLAIGVQIFILFHPIQPKHFHSQLSTWKILWIKKPMHTAPYLKKYDI